MQRIGNKYVLSLTVSFAASGTTETTSGEQRAKVQERSSSSGAA